LKPTALKKIRRSPKVFFQGILSELQKVSWPSRLETRNLTIVVVAVSVGLGLVLGLLDFGFTELFDKVFFQR
jgi:preprotein translocase subunit SecE